MAWSKIKKILPAVLVVIITMLSVSCSSGYKYEYNSLDNFNDEFSIDYPKSWVFNSYSDNNTLNAYFSGMINKSTVELVAFSMATKDLGEGLTLDYYGLVDALLVTEDWSDKVIVTDAILENGTVFSVFGRQASDIIEYLYLCGISQDQTIIMKVYMNNASDKETQILNKICAQMVNSLRSTK